VHRQPSVENFIVLGALVAPGEQREPAGKGCEGCAARSEGRATGGCGCGGRATDSEGGCDARATDGRGRGGGCGRAVQLSAYS
jgi:hypothetical protein